MFEVSERLKNLPPYLFAEIDRKKKKLISEGHDIIDFGIGDPDLPTPENIVEAMKKGVGNASYHRYPIGKGMADFRKAISEYYRENCQVEIDPDSEVCVLIGSKEGIAHFPWAFLNRGDITLVPEPCYPVYHIGTRLSEGTPFFMPLKSEKGFLPDLGSIPSGAAEKARIMYLNYPNNPTAAFATRDFLMEAISFCKKHGIILAYDAAYSEIYFEEKPVSFLSLPGAKDVGIEFNSLSKPFNMTGWRAGWACGNASLVAGLAKIKENIDSGTFEAVQFSGVEALRNGRKSTEEMRKIYRSRRDLLVEGLRKAGFDAQAPGGAFYLWLKVGGSSIDFADDLLGRGKIVVTPGVGFGPSGEGFIRFSLTIGERIKEAIGRINKLRGKN